MPIRDEPSFDPNAVPSLTGNLGDLNDVNVSGVFDGALIVYDESVTGWVIGSGIGVTGSLDDLSDVNVGAASNGEFLGLVGGTWQGVALVTGSTITDLDDIPGVNVGPITSGQLLGYLGSTLGWTGVNVTGGAGATALTGLNDVTITSVLNNHGLVYNSSVSKYVNSPILSAPTGLSLANTAAAESGNTITLQAALNRGGMVYIPSGTYRIQPLFMNTNFTSLVGLGTLLVSTGYTAHAILSVSGSNCLVEGPIFDGNRSGFSAAAGRGEGIRIAGDYNTVRNVKVLNVPTGGSANSIAVVFGDNNLVENCYVSGAGFAAYYCNGDYNTFRNNIALNYYAKGFTFNGGPYNKLTVDGFYADQAASVFQTNGGGASFQIDPGPNSTDYIREVVVRNIFVTNGTSNGASAKFAKIDNLLLEKCTFYPNDTGSATQLQIAEGIHNLTIKNSWIASYMDFDAPVGDFTIDGTRFGEYPGSFVGNGGSGWNPTACIFDLQSSGYVRITNCEFFGYNGRAIDIDNPPVDSDPAGYQQIWIENCHFMPSGAGIVRDIAFTSNGSIDWSRRFGYFRNRRTVYGGGTPQTVVSTWLPVITPLNYALTQYAGTSAPTTTSISFRVGDEVINTGATSGQYLGWRCVASGAPGTWLPFGDVGNLLQQSYFTGVNDTVLSGIPSTGADVTTQFKNFFNNIQNNTVVRISPGIYRLTDTVTAYGKNNITFDCRGATFIEVNRLPSGTFWFDRCTGISWDGGYITGADTLSYLLATASGIERSGIGFEDLGPAGDTGESARKVLGQTFNLNFCKDITITNVRTVGKYRNFVDYFGENIKLSNLYHQGVQTGFSINSTDERPLLGTGTVTFGEYYKEGSRNSASYSFGKTSHVIISNCITENIGNMIVAGTPSLGGGGSATTNNLIITHCIAHNVYDNGIYLSSMHKADVTDFRVINDPGIPHASIVGMKGRGSYIRFNNCHVQNTHGGYGIEGFGGSADYWTNGGSVGWTSEGCAIIGCTASGTVGPAVFLDRNNSIYPRDVLIQGNYFFQCGLGPSGRIPTGYLSTQIGDISAIILANDGYRTKIIDNTIENSGSLCADNGIFVGNKFLGTSVFITGAEIRGNRLLGQKVGIYLRNADYARVRDNYGERIGANNYGFTTESGTPALIQTYNVRNSFFTDNILAPSGHAFVLRTKPTGLWENNIVRDNIGTEQIN